MASTVFHQKEASADDCLAVKIHADTTDSNIESKEKIFRSYTYTSSTYLYVRLTFPKSVQSIVHVYQVSNSTTRNFAGTVVCSDAGVVTYTTEYKGSNVTITTGTRTFTLYRNSGRCDTLIENFTNNALPTVSNLESV